MNDKQQDKANNPSQENQPLGFVDDSSGEVNDTDLYHRKSFAETLSKNLLKPYTDNSSSKSDDSHHKNEAFALGIVGEWGGRKNEIPLYDAVLFKRSCLF